MRAATSQLKYSKSGLTAVALLALAGCGGGPSGNSGDAADVLGNLAAFNSPRAPDLPPARRREVPVDCPIVQVADGQSAYRAYAGADRSSAGVKYQYSIGEVARECIAADGQIEIRIGISGYVQAGPAGASGTFNVPLRVVIRREGSDAAVVTKIYRVPTSIPPGDAATTFAHVTETINLPYLREAADEDYSIFVGFDGSGGENKPATAASRRPRRRG